MKRAKLWLLAVVLAGCEAPAPAPPASVTDDAGVAVRIDSAPARIVSLIPATTELVFALGAGERLVGRTSWCDYPAEASRVPDLGNGIGPNVEAVVAAHPDLVLLYKSGANRNAAEQLRRFGIPTLELATDRIEDFFRITRLLGIALGMQAPAESLVARITRELEAVDRRSAAATPPSVFIRAWDRPVMTLGQGSFLTEILERAGARNLFHDLSASSATISIETVAQRDPDFILTVGTEDPVYREEWRVVRAVRERRFLRVEGSEFNRPSPRIAAAVRRLSAALDSARR